MNNSNNNGAGSEKRGCMKLNDDTLANAIKKKKDCLTILKVRSLITHKTLTK